jgi:hypothetical protein
MDQYLIFVVAVAAFAIIWLFYALVNQKARPEGIALVGYGAVAACVVMTLVFFGVALYR